MKRAVILGHLAKIKDQAYAEYPFTFETMISLIELAECVLGSHEIVHATRPGPNPEDIPFYISTCTRCGWEGDPRALPPDRV